jgi:hypothetical protein
MAPHKAVRLAMVLIPLSIAIAIVAVAIGQWFVFTAMILNLVIQTISLVGNRRRLRGG